MEKVKLEVGQRLWWVNTISGCGAWVEVTKIGPVYAHISREDLRIRLTDLNVVWEKGPWQAGRCYVSKEVCEAREIVQEKCDEMCRKMLNNCSGTVTVEQVEAAMRLLGL